MKNDQEKDIDKTKKPLEAGSMSSKDTPTWLIATLVAIPLAAILMIIIVLTAPPVATKSGSPVVVQDPPKSSPAPKPNPKSTRCIAAPNLVVGSLQEGFNTAGLTLRNAYSVKSNDFSKVYFISADIQGEGLEGENDIVTLATNSLEIGGGIFMSVNGAAKEFFVFPDASTTDAKLTTADDGAKLSQDCVKN